MRASEIQNHVITRCWKMAGKGIFRSSSVDELRLLPCSYLSTVGGLLLFDKRHSGWMSLDCSNPQTHRVNKKSRKLGQKILSTLTVFKNKSVASALLWVLMLRQPHLLCWEEGPPAQWEGPVLLADKHTQELCQYSIALSSNRRTWCLALLRAEVIL